MSRRSNHLFVAFISINHCCSACSVVIRGSLSLSISFHVLSASFLLLFHVLVVDLFFVGIHHLVSLSLVARGSLPSLTGCGLELPVQDVLSI